MIHYFKKINIRNPVSFNGNAIRFEPVAGHDGVIQLDDSHEADKVTELERLAGARKMGVVIISSAIYEALKKNSPSKPSPNQPGVLRQQVRLAPEKQSLSKPNPPVVVVPSVATVSPPAQAAPPVVPVPSSNGKPIASPIQFKAKRGKLSSLEKGSKVNEGGS